jgi:hypothetical protein
MICQEDKAFILLTCLYLTAPISAGEFQQIHYAFRLGKPGLKTQASVRLAGKVTEENL